MITLNHAGFTATLNAHVVFEQVLYMCIIPINGRLEGTERDWKKNVENDKRGGSRVAMVK